MDKHLVAFPRLLILCIFVLVCVTIGCSSNDKDNSIYNTRNVGGSGDDNNTPASSDDDDDASAMNGIDVVQTEGDLPDCGDNTKGQLFLVLDTSGFQYCDGIEYVSLDSLNIPEAGEDGKTSLLAMNSEAPGENCLEGGVKISTGMDDNADGVLDSDEIDNTVYICNGASGSDGEDGKTARIKIDPEPEGINCFYGGLKIDIGIDDNENETLDDEEVQETSYICNPPPICDEEKIFDGDMVIDSETDLTTVTGYISVTGSITIENLGTTDLTFLSCLTRINGDLVIRDTQLTSLKGLHNVTYVGGNIAIYNNNNLENLAELNKVTTLQSLGVFDNNALTALGLDALTDVDFVVFISGNPELCTALAVALTDHVQFPQVNECCGIEIFANKCCEGDDPATEPYYCGVSPEEYEEGWLE